MVVVDLIVQAKARCRASMQLRPCVQNLASAYRRAEDVRVTPIVIPELKFRDVQRHIFGANLVECADNAALKDRPEALNRVRVNRADNVLMFLVVNGAVAVIITQIPVSRPGVGRQQTDLVGPGLINEIENGGSLDATHNTSDHISLALYCTNDWRLAVEAAFLFIPMAVGVLTAHVGFINFNDAAKLLLRLYHPGADFVAHRVRRLITAEAHLPLNLQGGNALFAGGHQMNDFEPLPQRFVGVLKD